MVATSKALAGAAVGATCFASLLDPAYAFTMSPGVVPQMALRNAFTCHGRVHAAVARSACLARPPHGRAVLAHGIKMMADEVSTIDEIEVTGDDSTDFLGAEPSREESGEGIEPDDVRNFPISDETMDALAARGITKLFPVQAATFNEIYNGRDVLARARTGTGKTLGFALPIIERIIKAKKENGNTNRTRGQKPVCVVLSPTRELAQQVEREIEALTTHSVTRVHTLCVYGGVAYQKQERALRDGIDLVVGTPGRMIDLMKNGVLDLSTIEYIVLDEADEMLNRLVTRPVSLQLRPFGPHPRLASPHFPCVSSRKCPCRPVNPRLYCAAETFVLSLAWIRRISLHASQCNARAVCLPFR